MKQSYAFVFMESGHLKAIRELNGSTHGRKQLKAELARGDGIVKRREDSRRSDAQRSPNETLFVVNFDPITTRTRDLEELFGRYGRIVRVHFFSSFLFIAHAL